MSKSSAKKTPGSGEREVQSVARALAILETVAAAGECGVTEIGRAVGLHVATVHNILRTLANHDYLENQGGRYHLGSAVGKLAGQGDDTGALADYLQPWMERLSQETGEAASASVLGDGLARIVAFHPGTHALTIQFPQRLWPDPLGLATGRLLVSELSEREWETFVPSGDDSERRADWIGRLAAIREHGFCVFWQSEQVAMAFPVRSRFERAVCAIGASTPMSRATPDHCSLVFAAIRGMARDLSRQFGCPAASLDTIANTAPPAWGKRASV